MKKTTVFIVVIICCFITACVTFMGARYRYLHALLPHEGTITYTDGSTYEGMISNGLPHGHGKFTKPSGSWAEGDFCNSLANGQFTIHSVKQNRDFDTLLVNTPLK